MQSWETHFEETKFLLQISKKYTVCVWVWVCILVFFAYCQHRVTDEFERCKLICCSWVQKCFSTMPFFYRVHIFIHQFLCGRCQNSMCLAKEQ